VYLVQYNRKVMEIERIVASDGSLFREDCDEYIVTDCDSGLRNAACR